MAASVDTLDDYANLESIDESGGTHIVTGIVNIRQALLIEGLEDFAWKQEENYMKPTLAQIG